MLRSQINQLMAEAEALFARHGYVPPPWAFWSPAQWAHNPEQAGFCAAHQMGWDVTDFGSGRFFERGLLLLCTRNGIPNVPGERPYAEKIMVVREEQETPYHWHKVKAEDIINRGGGDLVVEVAGTDRSGPATEGAIDILVDAAIRRVPAAAPIVLGPGESVTLFPGQAHRFYGRRGSGTVLVGEVSQVNDDLNDNVFLDDVGRFAAIEEDEAARHPLWSELHAD